MTTPEIFQLAEDDEETDLGNITAVSVRKQANGSWFSIPMKYDIESLDNVEKLHALLGPGLFELVGRDDRTRQIVRRVKVNIPGIPWASWDKPSSHEPPETRQATAPVQSGHAMGGDTGLVVALLQFMGQQSASQAQMMLAMVQMSSKNSDAHVAAMGQMFTNFGTAQSSLLEKIMNHDKGGDPQTSFLRGVEMAAEIQRGAREGNDEPAEPGNELGEMVDAVAKGVDMFAKVKGLATNGES